MYVASGLPGLRDKKLHNDVATVRDGGVGAGCMLYESLQQSAGAWALPSSGIGDVNSQAACTLICMCLH
jgi:hypothetical protein